VSPDGGTGVGEESSRAGDDESPLRVLYVDGNEEARESMVAFAEHSPGATVEVTASLAAAERELSAGGYDCVVTEQALPDGDVSDVVASAGADCPVVLYTEREAGAVAEAAFADGVVDVVAKREGGLGFLWEKVRGAVQRRSEDGETSREPVETELLAALLDATGEAVWTGGAVDRVGGVPVAGFRRAVAEAVAEGSVFERRLGAAAAGETVGDIWPTADGEGALEHRSYPVDVPGVERLELLQDVSARRERDRRLEQFQRLLETAQDGLYALDANGRYEYVNGQMAEMVGHDREELLGAHSSLLMADGEFERGQALVAEVVTEGRESGVMELTARRADGTTFPAEIRFAPLYDQGTYTGLVGVMRDVSERRERERRLQENERRYRTVAENIPNGSVALFDEELRYTLVEGAMFENMEYDAGDFEGAHISDIHTEAYVERFASAFEAVFEGEQTSFELSHDGRHYRSRLVPIEGADGSVIAGLALSVDITEQREYERELERQNERLNEFASIVSHDLRNPLNVVEGHLQLYRERGDEDHLEAVAEGVERMERLIDDLLELARQGRSLGDREPVDVGRRARECWAGVPTDGATVEVEPVGTVEADPDRLAQLFENLFRNAVEHAGPEATVVVGPLDGDGGADAGFYVADDGPGVPAGEREQVFEYGHTDAEGGTGIGLAIVAEIASAHGWDVSVTESEAGGARFEVRT
jgi:PAS domain S-box-containing protein